MRFGVFDNQQAALPQKQGGNENREGVSQPEAYIGGTVSIAGLPVPNKRELQADFVHVPVFVEMGPGGLTDFRQPRINLGT